MKEENQLAKWLSGEMEPEALEAFRKTPEFAAYEKIAQYSTLLQPPPFDAEKMYSGVISQQKKAVKVISVKTWFLRIAAVWAIGLGCWLGAKHFSVFTETAAAGQMTAFDLPDDSQVVLNSGSEIRYKKWDWDRKRALDLKGEAYFKVAKGRTFDVLTNLGKVTVVGTQFNVKAREKRFEVECFEGTVWVICGPEKVVLNRGDLAVFENGERLPIASGNGAAPPWTEQEIRVLSLPLGEIIAELERDYNVKIEARTSSTSQKFTGTLPKNDLKTALQILSETYGFALKTEADGRMVLIPK